MTVSGDALARPGARCPRTAWVAIVVALVAIGGTSVPAGARAGRADAGDAAARQLVERHAPVLELKAQESPCDRDGEPYAPTSVDTVLGNPDVVLRQVGAGNPVLQRAPTARDLYGRSAGFYLDFPGDAKEPGCIYEQDFDRYTATVTGRREPVVYARIATQADRPDRLAVQYWFFWYFNDWNNTHEGDWEGIQLLFDVGTVDAALRRSPVSVGYAQHEGGERAGWNDSKLERVGERPVVYPSAGSHASYFDSSLFLGRSASEGFGCDTTVGPSVRADPTVVLLPDEPVGPESPFAWLAFNGRWGERGSGPFNAPTGPRDKRRWDRPVDWHEALRPASATVPAGEGSAAAVASVFCDVVAGGSRLLVRFESSPVAMGSLVVAAFVVVRLLVRRTSWVAVAPAPLVRRRRIGQILRASPVIYRRRIGTFLAIGLVYLPTAAVASALAALAARLPWFGGVAALSGESAATSAAFSLLVGGPASLASFVAINAMVAGLVEPGADPDGEHTDRTGVAVGLAVARRALRRAPDLLVGLVIATLAVGLLAATVIAVPLAIWLAVRLQFMAQVVMVEGLGGRAALVRSWRLTRGRWFHTAALTLLVNGLVVAVALTGGLLLLVVAEGMPMWALSPIMTSAGAVLVPLAAVATTLLYGDAVAQDAGAPPADELPAGAPGAAVLA